MIELAPKHFEEISEFVLNYSGILLERVPKLGVSERIKKHIASLHLESPVDYLNLLRNPGKLRIRDELISLITVNESYFFRNPLQFKYLAKTLLPRLHKEKQATGENSIKIWSAGCATGEEAYSIAYIARWFLRRYSGIKVVINASDINTLSLETAKNRLYRKRSFREQYKSIVKEFGIPLARECGNFFEIDADLQEMIDFSCFNLKDIEGLKTFEKTDIIFCRNVLIYFEDNFKQDLISGLHKILTNGGEMFLGETETLPPHQKLFALVNCNGSYCYRKESEDAA